MGVKTRVGATKILGNGILFLKICLDVSLDLELFPMSLFTRDPRNVTSGVERMLVGVPVAALHAVLKTRVGETKMQGNDIFPLRN